MHCVQFQTLRTCTSGDVQYITFILSLLKPSEHVSSHDCYLFHFPLNGTLMLLKRLLVCVLALRTMNIHKQQQYLLAMNEY